MVCQPSTQLVPLDLTQPPSSTSSIQRHSDASTVSKPLPLRRQHSAPSFEEEDDEEEEEEDLDTGGKVRRTLPPFDVRLLCRSLSDSAPVSAFRTEGQLPPSRKPRNVSAVPVHAKRLKCENCEKTFASSSGYKKHHESKHMGIR